MQRLSTGDADDGPTHPIILRLSSENAFFRPKTHRIGVGGFIWYRSNVRFWNKWNTRFPETIILVDLNPTQSLCSGPWLKILYCLVSSFEQQTHSVLTALFTKCLEQLETVFEVSLSILRRWIFGSRVYVHVTYNCRYLHEASYFKRCHYVWKKRRLERAGLYVSRAFVCLTCTSCPFFSFSHGDMGLLRILLAALPKLLHMDRGSLHA